MVEVSKDYEAAASKVKLAEKKEVSNDESVYDKFVTSKKDQ